MSKFLWALLVDVSGSMGEPFSGKELSDVNLESGAYQTKLDAAKDQVLRAINSLPKKDTNILVIAFSDRAHLVCKSPSDNLELFSNQINTLKANGNTNIASAILLALDETGMHEYPSFLLISDGLSNNGDPIAAAQKCADNKPPIQISTILIDPNDESNKLAKEISDITGGRNTAVTSTIKLGTALAKEQKELVQQATKNTFITLIAAITATVTLLAAITGIYSAIAEKPFVSITGIVAAISTIGCCVLFYFVFAKEEVPGIYKNAKDKNLQPPKIKISKFGNRVRFYSLIGGTICLLITIALIVVTILTAMSIVIL